MENEYESKLIRTCPKCNETKPLKEFRYKLTRAQMKAQGFVGNHIVTAEGKVCTSCRPKRKPLYRLTTKELITKASSGDIHPFIAKSRIENIKKTAQANRKAKRTEGWHKLWTKWLKELVEPLTKDIARSQHQRMHSIKVGKHARAAFFEVYIKELQKVKTKMLYDQRTNPREPMFCCWQEYFPMEKARVLRELWNALPLADRTTMHTLPTMVRYIYKADDKRLFKRPRRPTPAERLAHGGGKPEHI